MILVAPLPGGEEQRPEGRSKERGAEANEFGDSKFLRISAQEFSGGDEELIALREMELTGCFANKPTLHQKRKERINMENKTQDKGFTLVELLIVIVILGILATVTVFAVRGITDKGKTNACDIEAKTIETAAEAYYAQEGNDPGNITTLFTYGFLKDDPSVNWVYTAGTGTTSASVAYSATGKCA